MGKKCGLWRRKKGPLSRLEKKEFDFPVKRGKRGRVGVGEVAETQKNTDEKKEFRCRGGKGEEET